MNSFNKFNHTTQLIGVIGHPIKHSYSPLMHNIAMDLAGLDYIYLPFDVPESNLKDAIKGVVALGIVGLNVTIPHKEKIVPYLDDISEEASVIGAVNTIVNENGSLRGFNTDVNGVFATLEEYKEELNASEVSIIGCGGAARSVLYTLIRHFNPGKINLINRTVEKAESLRDYLSEKMIYDEISTFELIPPDLTEIISRSKLVVNTTSVGMAPEIDDSPIASSDAFNDNQIVFDVVYNPIKTKLLSLAESKGAKAVNGLKMFVEQGAKAYELWTGEQMDSEKIYGTLKSYMLG